jgi:hypothetical protein
MPVVEIPGRRPSYCGTCLLQHDKEFFSVCRKSSVSNLAKLLKSHHSDKGRRPPSDLLNLPSLSGGRTGLQCAVLAGPRQLAVAETLLRLGCGAEESNLLYTPSHTTLHTKPPRNKKILVVKKRKGASV